MTKIINCFFIFVISILFSNSLMAQDYEPIISQVKNNVDTFYSKYIVDDKYRWLENINSTESKDWIGLQNNLAENYLKKTIHNTRSDVSIENLGQIEYNYAVKKGKYYFRNYTDSRGIPILTSQSSFHAPRKVVVDPTDISKTDAIVIDGYSVSKNSKLLAYNFSRNGSDWNEIKVVSLNDSKQLKDHLKDIKFVDIAWLGNGFFYSTFSQAQQFGETKGQRVYYHEIGTSQENDKLIFERKNNLSALFEYCTTSDERFFILKEINQDEGTLNIFYIDYSDEKPILKPLLLKQKNDIEIVDGHEGKFIATTSYQSNNRSIVEIDPNDPMKWSSIVPEFSDAILLKTLSFKDRILAIYQSNQHPILRIFDYSGAFLYEEVFPIIATLDGFSGNNSDEEFLYHFSSYVIPPIIYKFNIRTFKTELLEKTKLTYDLDNIECKDVIYLTKDSVPVPMVLLYKKGLKLDGKNPTLLKAYGGFGIVERPTFDPAIVYFVKSGGVFAFANIRGGGDKGVKWANSGRGNKKQNSFNDFIAAAEFLIKEKYTSPSKLATTGASNGGLVVAVSAIQRPDLFKAVVPIVAPLDMIRFEQFTVGSRWEMEYGTIKDSLSFTKLFKYSPYNNVKEDINYPSMLIVTSENDDRVPPFHSYKFAAKLQSRIVQKNPIILMIEKKSGHSGATNYDSWLIEESKIYGFIMNELMKK